MRVSPFHRQEVQGQLHGLRWSIQPVRCEAIPQPHFGQMSRWSCLSALLADRMALSACVCLKSEGSPQPRSPPPEPPARTGPVYSVLPRFSLHALGQLPVMGGTLTHFHRRGYKFSFKRKRYCKVTWNSLCALGFHSGGYIPPPGNPENEAMRPMVTREHSLALSVYPDPPPTPDPGKCFSHLGL